MNLRPVFTFALCLTALTACQPRGGFLPSGADDSPVTQTGQQIPGAMCSGDPALGQRMIEAVNAARAREGKTLLESDETLTSIAQSHACDIAATGRASVAGSDGSNVVERARAAGYRACGVAQLVSTGGSPEATVGSWMLSEPHRTQLLTQLTEQIGVGATRGSDGRIWWSVVLGEDCG